MLMAISISRLPAQQTGPDRQHFSEVKAQADRGNAEAQVTLGDLYLTGKGVKQDLGKAAKWHRKAAEQSLARGQYQYGLDCANGYGVKMNPADGAAWIRRAAEQGLPEALLACGFIYARGEGVRADPVEAVKYFRRAAELNQAEAIYELGECYLKGNGVAKDITEGVKWTRKAAEQGCAPAQNRLGLCYMKGEGLAKDYLEAYKWFNLASAHGEEQTYDFKVNLAKVATLMTAEQVAEAQRLARDFRPLGGDRVTSGATLLGGSKTGVVNVTADDDRCEIWVDGAFVGNAPAKVKLAEGSHGVEVKKAGYKDFSKRIQVTEGADLTLRATLEKQ